MLQTWINECDLWKYRGQTSPVQDVQEQEKWEVNDLASCPDLLLTVDINNVCILSVRIAVVL